MIPAILSCVFVLYLYRTLDAANSDEASVNESDLTSDGNAAELTKELKSIHLRLERIASQTKGDNQ